jgi:hypothetical protein
VENSDKQRNCDKLSLFNGKVKLIKTNMFEKINLWLLASKAKLLHEIPMGHDKYLQSIDNAFLLQYS